MTSTSEQLTTLRRRQNSLESRLVGLSPNPLIYAASGDKVLYGCKVTEGDDNTNMVLQLDGQYAGDTDHLNPDVSGSPLYPFQYPNIASLRSGAFYVADDTLDVTLDDPPATGLGRYDIVYIFLGPTGAGMDVATGTPGSGVKTDFDDNGLDTSAYGDATITDPAIPVGATAIARVYVEDVYTGVQDARIADIRVFGLTAQDIDTLAGISGDITAVANISGNVSTVAGISADVTTVAAIDTDVTTVAGVNTEVQTVAGISADVTTVAGVSGDVTTVAGISANVTAVADNETNINTVAGIDSNITTVAGISTDVTSVADISGNVTTVAGISVDVSTVAGISGNVTTVAGRDADIGTLADIEDGTTATDAISTVAGISGDVTTVAGIDTNVTTVAGISADVTDVANNITAVQNAEQNANDAQTFRNEAETFAGSAADSAAEAADVVSNDAIASIQANFNYSDVQKAIYVNDIGPWRTRCQHLSWYDETKPRVYVGQYASVADVVADGGSTGEFFYSTTSTHWEEITDDTSGSETSSRIFAAGDPDFPAEVVISAVGTGSSTRLIIHDATKARLPMWMEFQSSDNNLLKSTTITGLSLVSGVIYSAGSSSIGSGLRLIDFLGDFSFRIAGTKSVRYQGRINERNDGNSEADLDTRLLPSAIVNALATYTAPDAPIDQVSGEAIPYVAGATDGGTFVIQPEGTVISSIATAARGHTAVLAGRLYETTDVATDVVVDNGPIAELSDNYDNVTVWDSSSNPGITSGAIDVFTRADESLLIGFDGGEINLLRPNPSTPADSTIQKIGPNFNTGPYIDGAGTAAIAVDTDESDLTQDDLFLLLDGNSGNYASTPDSAANSVTGDIDIRADAVFDEFSDSLLLVAKWVASSDNNAFFLRSPVGLSTLELFWSEDGTSNTNKSAESTQSLNSVGILPGSRAEFRVILDVDNGSDGYDVNFYYRFNSGDSWTQLGNTITGGTTTSIFDSSADIEIGSRNSGSNDIFDGKIYHAEVRDGIDGTVVVDFDAEDYDGGSTFTSAETSETWTLNGDAAIGGIDDRTGNLRPFAYNGTLTRTAISPGGIAALSGFSASDYAWSTDSAFDVSSGATIKILFNAPNNNTAGALLFTGADSANAGFEIVINSAGQIYVGDRSTTITSPGSYGDGNWHTVVVAMDSNLNVSLIIDDVEVSSGSLDLSSYSFDEIDIGERPPNSIPWPGSIAVVTIESGILETNSEASYWHKHVRSMIDNGNVTIANAVQAAAHDPQSGNNLLAETGNVREFRNGARVATEFSNTGTIADISTGKRGERVESGSTGLDVLVPSRNLREPDLKPIKKRFTIQYSGDGSRTQFPDQSMQSEIDAAAGGKPVAVWDAGSLQTEGSSDDYTVEFNGFNYWAEFAVAPGNGNDVIVEFEKEVTQ